MGRLGLLCQNDMGQPSMMDDTDSEYRICSVCGGDCEPDPSATDGLGVRVVFVCSEHGPQSVVDPFDDLR